MVGEDEEGPDALNEYLEDIFVEDIGLTWVTSKWNIPDALSAEDAERFCPKGEPPSAWWLTLPESAVENFDRSKARQLGQDIRRLVQSPLPDGTIRTVWLGATHGSSDPEVYGFDARAWLRKLEDAWLARVRQDDPAFTPPPPQPVLLGRLRSDRVMRRPTPPRVYDPKGGRPPKHGREFVFGDPGTWGAEQAVTTTGTRLYGKATAQAWDRLHPRLTHRADWIDHDGPLPIIEGTVIRLAVEKLPSGGVNKPVWLWWSGTAATTADVDRCWQSFLRRFDLEHPFRLFKQTLGVDQTPASQLGSGRPVDVAGGRCLCPAPARPPAGHRPEAALGEAKPRLPGSDLGQPAHPRRGGAGADLGQFAQLLQPHVSRYWAVRSRAVSAALVAAATASAPFGLARNQRRFCSVAYARRTSASASSVPPSIASALRRYPGAAPAERCGARRRRVRTRWSPHRRPGRAAGPGPAGTQRGRRRSPPPESPARRQ
jgi:hypothetical protein